MTQKQRGVVMDYGQRVKELLDERGLSQSEVARMIGVKQQTVSGWVARKYLSTKVIEDLCEALRIDIREFFLTEEYITDRLKVDRLALGIIQRIEMLDEDLRVKVYTAVNDVLAIAESGPVFR